MIINASNININLLELSPETRANNISRRKILYRKSDITVTAIFSIEIRHNTIGMLCYITRYNKLFPNNNKLSFCLTIDTNVEEHVRLLNMLSTVIDAISKNGITLSRTPISKYIDKNGVERTCIWCRAIESNKRDMYTRIYNKDGNDLIADECVGSAIVYPSFALTLVGYSGNKTTLKASVSEICILEFLQKGMVSRKNLLPDIKLSN